jgi:hypothetical protein
MSHSQVAPFRTLLALLLMAAALLSFAANNKQTPPPPEHAKAPVPAVTNDYIHREFGDNCSLLEGSAQFVGDLDGDGIDDLVVAARCKNPMADSGEYGFLVSDPYDAYFGYGNVKVTSGFISEDPERKGVVLLIVHGVGPEAWRSDKPKPKFLLINLSFNTLAVKRLSLKKRTVLGVYMEEQAEGEQMSSVVFWDGKKYRFQMLGTDLE